MNSRELEDYDEYQQRMLDIQARHFIYMPFEMYRDVIHFFTDDSGVMPPQIKRKNVEISDRAKVIHMELTGKI